MDTLQDFLTLAATVIEYFFFMYLAVALMVYSLKSSRPVEQAYVSSAFQAVQQRSLAPDTPLAVMAG